MNLIQKTLITILAGVLFTLISHQTASAYYDPGVQRWINRDPIDENGHRSLRHTIASSGSPHDVREANGYTFVINDPVLLVDPLGQSTMDDLCDPNSKNRLCGPEKYDNSNPEHRDALKECYKKAQAYDAAVVKKSGEHISSGEFLKVLEDCLRCKNIIPPGRDK